MELKFTRFFLFVSFFLLASSSLTSQVLKFRTTALATNEKKESGGWKGWTEFKESNLLVTLDTEAQRIIIYANETQKFDITEYDELKKDEDGDDVFTFYCVDNEGVNCRIRFMTLHSQDGRRQVYVDYEDIGFAFNIYLLD